MSNIFGNVLIGGGSGFIGSHLTKLLQIKGYNVTIISRMPGPNRMTWHDLNKFGLPKRICSVVNLAGQNVLDVKQRWSAGFKQNIWNSRICTTQALADAITKSPKPPNSFIVMSGVGIYKPCANKEYTEESKTKEFDFLSELCHAWEHASKLPKIVKCRRVIIRSGVVLGRKGGMVQQLFLPFYFGLGGPIASGKQFLPWIHIDDICRLILYIIENKEADGVLNGVAPQQITNLQFTKAFGRALNRPTIMAVPEGVLKVIFNEERAKIMTDGQRVVPKRTLETGYKFKYPDIDSACKEFARL